MYVKRLQLNNRFFPSTAIFSFTFSNSNSKCACFHKKFTFRHLVVKIIDINVKINNCRIFLIPIQLFLDHIYDIAERSVGFESYLSGLGVLLYISFDAHSNHGGTVRGGLHASVAHNKFDQTLTLTQLPLSIYTLDH